MIPERKKENIFLIDDRKKCNDCQLNEGQEIYFLVVTCVPHMGNLLSAASLDLQALRLSVL